MPTGWLAWQCGLSPGAAREHVRVARALGRLPATSAAFADGRAPDLPDAMHVNGEPMDLAYVVGVLLANRDLERRLATENADTERAGGLVAVA